MSEQGKKKPLPSITRLAAWFGAVASICGSAVYFASLHTDLVAETAKREDLEKRVARIETEQDRTHQWLTHVEMKP